MIVLQTPRTCLRKLVVEDVDGIMGIFGDEAAMKFAPIAATQDHSVARSAIAWHFENYERIGYSAWAIIGKADGVFIGIAGLLPQPAGAELFFSLVPRHWNHGFATEVACGCRDYAFRGLGLGRLIAMIHPENSRAIAVVRKIGMTAVGTVRHWDRENQLFEIKNAAL